MSGDDTSSYAPKSPDFSSFFSGPTDQAQPPPPPPPPPPLDLGPSSHNQQFRPPSFDYTSSYVPPTSTSFNHGGYDSYHPPSQLQQQGSFSHTTLGGQPSYAPEPPRWQDSGQLFVVPADFDDPYPLSRSQEQPQPQPQPEPERQPPAAEAEAEAEVEVEAETKRRQKKQKMPPRKAAKEPSPPAAPIIDSSMVRTKFPTARIKRIMQADEEVGKVAQQTPIAVGKALELFMIQLVSRSAEVARDKGSRRVTASMLKQVVESDEQWDFLREIVGRVEADKETAKKEPKAKVESDSEEEPQQQPKRRRGERGAGRKKRGC